ncbi:thiol reductant ABC exporter subunit CydD [Pontibacterium sp.]|uniref:thiol reductant ABC exporter subunit CydD n=1 Tax=Pontibacterium sp. TaxID=2036026 RepID=UPI0035193ECE
MKQTTTTLFTAPDSKTLLRLCNQLAAPEYRWLTLLGALQTLNTIAFAALIAWLINDTVYLGHHNWQQSPFWLALGAVLSLQALLPLVRGRIGDRASIKIRRALREQILQHCRQLGIQLQPEFSASELSTLLSREIDSLRGYFAEFQPQQRLAMLSPILIIVATSFVNWLVPLMLALTAPLIPLFMIIVGHKAADASRQNLQQLNRLGSLLADRLKGLETLQQADTIQTEQEQLFQQSDQYRRATMKVLRLAFLSGTLLEFFSAISVALVAVYLGLFFLGKYDLGSWQALTLAHGIFLLMLAPEFYLPLRRLGALYHTKADATSVAEHLLKLFQLTPVQPHTNTRHTLNGSEPISRLELNDLQCGYHNTAVGTPVSLQLTPGERALLCGPSGIGKSTLLDTVVGLLPALHGEIICNGKPICSFHNTEWQRRIGYMTQQPELLYASIRDNLCLGHPFSDEQLFDALHSAQVDEVVQALPGGLDYTISDNGGYLSGGQAQRIALARVFLHQPDLLLLDEATASLDDATADAFMQGLERYCQQGGMVLMVSHRQQDRALFDQIIELAPPPAKSKTPLQETATC